MGEDTLRETPVAKASDPHINVGKDGWQPPRKPSVAMVRPDGSEPPQNGARIDFGFGQGRVHTFEAKGPLAFFLGVLVLLVIGVSVALMFVFAVGAGAAIAAGAAVAAALGMGAARLRRRLSGGKSRELHDRRRVP
jgi:hypothetical protein